MQKFTTIVRFPAMMSDNLPSVGESTTFGNTSPNNSANTNAGGRVLKGNNCNSFITGSNLKFIFYPLLPMDEYGYPFETFYVMDSSHDQEQ